MLRWAMGISLENIFEWDEEGRSGVYYRGDKEIKAEIVSSSG